MSDKKSHTQPKVYVALGTGFCGDYNTIEEAKYVIAHNGNGRVYVAMDSLAARIDTIALRDIWNCSECVLCERHRIDAVSAPVGEGERQKCLNPTTNRKAVDALVAFESKEV